MPQTTEPIPKKTGHGVPVQLHRTNTVLMTFLNYTKWDFELTNRHYPNNPVVQNCFSPGQPKIIQGIKDKKDMPKPVQCALSFWDVREHDGEDLSLRFHRIKTNEYSNDLGFALKADVMAEYNSANYINGTKIASFVTTLALELGTAIFKGVTEKKFPITEVLGIINNVVFGGIDIANNVENTIKSKTPGIANFYAGASESADGYEFREDNQNTHYVYIIGEKSNYGFNKMDVAVKITGFRASNPEGSDLYNKLIEMDRILVELVPFDIYTSASREILIKLVRQYISENQANSMLLGQALDLYHHYPIDKKFELTDDIKIFEQLEGMLKTVGKKEDLCGIINTEVLREKQIRG